MSTARDILNEADRQYRIARQARAIVEGMAVERNRSHDIGGVTLYSHRGFEDHLVLVGAIRDALLNVAIEHETRAEALEASLTVVTK